MPFSIYRELRRNETRVLKLEPAKEYNDEIICSLVHISLEDPPDLKLSAMSGKISSYSWNENDEWPKEKLHSAIYNKDTKETILLNLTFEELRGAPFEELRRIYYQMGGSRSDGQITCDGQRITIGSELNEALRRIRLEDQQRTGHRRTQSARATDGRDLHQGRSSSHLVGGIHFVSF